MSNEEAIANIIRLMTSFNFDIKALLDDLKGAKCNSVLKNAYQMPCGCRFCRACIDDVISVGDQFCPGGMEESRSYREILIRIVANFSEDVEVLKRELLLKDEQVKHLENEMKSIKIENESIKREKEVLCDRVRQLSEKLEIDERYQSDEQDIAMATAVTSNRDEMGPKRGDILSRIDQSDCLKCQMESIQVAAGLGQLDDWLIEEDVATTDWRISAKKSGKFWRSYIFELWSGNNASMGDMAIFLRIWAGPGDSLLEWPFRGVVTITVAHRDRPEACSREMMQCEIERPADTHYCTSAPFVFVHDELRSAGLDLERGVRVSCRIVPGAGQ